MLLLMRGLMQEDKVGDGGHEEGTETIWTYRRVGNYISPQRS